MNAWLSLFVGLVLLYIGAQVLIKGGVALAFRLGLNALVVGLTVIAYGTSSPEAVVSVKASLADNGAIALGNVIGSNICNIALILAASALISPVAASTQVIRREIPIMIGVSALLAVLLWDGVLGRFDGALLFTGIVAYTWFTVRDARRAHVQHQASVAEAEFEAEIQPGQSAQPGLWACIGMVAIGLAVLVGGSHLFVGGAVSLAEAWGVSQAVIGLTIVAVGTSLPEFATSVVAAMRRHADVAIGNVVGSNIFNILGILGVAALLRPIDASDIGRFDLVMMVGVAFALLPLARSGGRIDRWEGAALLVLYIAYTAWLIRSMGHP